MASEHERRLTEYEAQVDQLQESIKGLEEEIVVLRRRLQDAPKRVRTLEERLLETKGQLAQAVSQNEKLSATLREAREHISALREEVEKLTMPPSAYGTYLGTNDDGTVDIFTAGRKMRVAVHPELETKELRRGQEGVDARVVQARPLPRTAGLQVPVVVLHEDGIVIQPAQPPGTQQMSQPVSPRLVLGVRNALPGRGHHERGLISAVTSMRTWVHRIPLRARSSPPTVGPDAPAVENEKARCNQHRAVHQLTWPSGRAAPLRGGCGDFGPCGRFLRHEDSLSSCVVAGERADHVCSEWLPRQDSNLEPAG